MDVFISLAFVVLFIFLAYLVVKRENKQIQELKEFRSELLTHIHNISEAIKEINN